MRRARTPVKQRYKAVVGEQSALPLQKLSSGSRFLADRGAIQGRTKE